MGVWGEQGSGQGWGRGSWVRKEGWGADGGGGASRVFHAYSFVAGGMSSPIADEKTEAQRLIG